MLERQTVPGLSAAIEQTEKPRRGIAATADESLTGVEMLDASVTEEIERMGDSEVDDLLQQLLTAKGGSR
jgi:hypothetical protein